MPRNVFRLIIIILLCQSANASRLPETLEITTNYGNYTNLTSVFSSLFHYTITRQGVQFSIVNISQPGLTNFGQKTLSPFNAPTSNTAFTINFSFPLTGFSCDMGDTDIDADTLTLKAYSGENGTGVLLATVTDSLPSSTGFNFKHLTVGGAGIRSVVMQGGSTAQPNSVYYDNFVFISAPTNADFEQDSFDDFTIYRNGTWWTLWSINLFPFGQVLQFGISTDRAASGDYDGDGLADWCVYRNGVWYIQQQQGNLFRALTFGTAEDKPTPADYDGDGITDVAVWRPSTGVWYILRSSDNAVFIVQWGANGDIPVQGYYDADGKTDFAVFRPSTGVWYLLRSSDFQFEARQWGIDSDKVVPADYDGDGRTDIAVFRNGTWYIQNTRTSNVQIVQWGLSSDIPTPAKFRDRIDKFIFPDGTTKIAVFRPSSGIWYVLGSQGSYSKQWGANGDVPISSVTNMQ